MGVKPHGGFMHQRLLERYPLPQAKIVPTMLNT
jgi:hypothetical protein